MRLKFFILFFILSATTEAQVADSAWLADSILPRYYVDTGTFLSNIKFIDEKGRQKTLPDFNRKILYIDLWATSCASCLVKFPYEEELSRRIKILHLDTSIVFININFEDSKNNWRKALKKYKPVGVNLHCNDTAILTKWNIDAPPAFVLLDKSGKVLGKDISQPDNVGTVDYILYAATKGIHPVEALWIDFRQGQLMSKYKTAAAITDKDYARWHSMVAPLLTNSFLRHHKQDKKQL